MKKSVKSLIKFLITVAASVFIVMAIDASVRGMWLFGIPDSENVKSVTLSYPRLTDETVRLCEEDDIELALNLTGFLRYDLFDEPDPDQKPKITMTFHMKDGTDKTIDANNETVWINKKAYSVKQEDMFINLTEGVFFLKYLPIE